MAKGKGNPMRPGGPEHLSRARVVRGHLPRLYEEVVIRAMAPKDASHTITSVMLSGCWEPWKPFLVLWDQRDLELGV